MNIPTPEKCYQLQHEMGMLDNIVVHCRQVCRVALTIANHFDGASANIDKGLIAAAALLHDITKTRSFKTKEDHAQTGEQYLQQRGYPEVARIVGQHVRLADYDRNGPPNGAEIINYADKRVLHDQVVSLDRRMQYIVDQYGTDPQRRNRIHWLWKQTNQLEERLFMHIAFRPHQLKAHLSASMEIDDLRDFKAPRIHPALKKH